MATNTYIADPSVVLRGRPEGKYLGRSLRDLRRGRLRGHAEDGQWRVEREMTGYARQLRRRTAVA